jgi:hypothetical protein
MGRGRQKAKQTKVARQLKYYSPETDYDALQRELATGNGHEREAAHDDAEDDEDSGEVEEDDEYADWTARGSGS